MEISEVKERKETLRLAINALISEFETVTGTTLRHIDVSHSFERTRDGKKTGAWIFSGTQISLEI